MIKTFDKNNYKIIKNIKQICQKYIQLEDIWQL